MNHLIKPFIAFIVISLTTLLSANSHAESRISTAFFSDVAVSGYDTVAYFTEHKAVKGDSDFSAEYQDATWHFSSQQNLELFQANPAQYAPQFGGYCAWAVSRGYTAESDPLAWKIIDTKLYLNFDFEVQAMWLKEAKQRIIKANKNWPEVLKKSS